MNAHGHYARYLLHLPIRRKLAGSLLSLMLTRAPYVCFCDHGLLSFGYPFFYVQWVDLL